MEKKKVLVVGGGGRCHAIVDALSRSEKVGKIYCAPGNAGIAVQAECVPLKDTQVNELKDFALARCRTADFRPDQGCGSHRVEQGFRQATDGGVQCPDCRFQDFR